METYLTGYRFYKYEIELLEKFLETKEHPVELVVTPMLTEVAENMMDEVFCDFYGPEGYPIYDLLNEYLTNKSELICKAVE